MLLIFLSLIHIFADVLALVDALVLALVDVLVLADVLALVEALVLAEVLAPVSYTHLDVYKRQ